MDDLISRQAAIDALERIFDQCEEIEAHLPKGDPDRVGYKMYPDWLTVWKYLHQLPSAQPEIIRCMECKWYKHDSDCYGYCTREGYDEQWYMVYATDFCSMPKRKEHETNRR